MLLLVRYGEIHLKGLNRPYFERLLKRNMEDALKELPGTTVKRGEGRFYVSGLNEEDYERAVCALKKVFGIHSLSPATETGKTMEEICRISAGLMREYMQKYGINHTTFKVIAKRSDKRFPLNSMQICAEVGGYLLESVEGLKVDVHKPIINLYIEVREQAFCYLDIIMGQGGLPVGSSGRAMLLLSGGIDSPVAGFMTAKRGVVVEAVHFQSPPYTSEAGKQKVLDLAKLVSAYAGHMRVHVVPFTEIQMDIYKNCPHEELVIIMRRFMMRIAERIARNIGAVVLVTGESIGQVASQTLESMNATGSVVNMPILRPLIGMDKLEIMERAEKIGTYETSILPFEDCCTVFVPKHPVTHPKLERIERSERRLPVDELVEKALAGVEIVDI